MKDGQFFHLVQEQQMRVGVGGSGDAGFCGVVVFVLSPLCSFSWRTNPGRNSFMRKSSFFMEKKDIRWYYEERTLQKNC